MGQENEMDRNDAINQRSEARQLVPPQTPVPPTQQMSYGMPMRPSYGQVPQSQYMTMGYGQVPQSQPVTTGYGMQQPMGSQMGQGAPQSQPVTTGYGMQQPMGSQMGQGAPQSQYMTTGYGMSHVYMERQNQGSEGMAIASLVLGIISILSCVWVFVGLPSAVAGLVLGCVYRGNGGKSGLSVAGIACSASGLTLVLLALFTMVWQ